MLRKSVVLVKSVGLFKERGVCRGRMSRNETEGERKAGALYILLESSFTFIVLPSSQLL